MSQGLLFIVCGPSGVGKTTLSRRLLDCHPRLELSVSYTTRPAREGESDGVDYHFVAEAEFEKMRASSAFAEWAEVHGNLYGTTRATIEKVWAGGGDVIFDIDYQGAAQLQLAFPEMTVATLVVPPSMRVLEERLRGRDTDPEAVIQKRLKNARDELAQFEIFDYVVCNDELDTAYAHLDTIYRASLNRLFLHRASLVDLLEE